METEEPVSPLPLPLAAQGRPCDDGLLVVEAKVRGSREVHLYPKQLPGLAGQT